MELKTETQKVKLVEENHTGSLADGRVAISYMLPSIRHESLFHCHQRAGCKRSWAKARDTSDINGMEDPHKRETNKGSRWYS